MSGRVKARGGSAKLYKQKMRQVMQARCQKYLNAARQKLDAGDFRTGYRAAAIANELANHKDFKQEKNLKDSARKVLADINTAATEQLVLAGHQYRNGEFSNAIKSYRVISSMTKLSAAKRADSKLELARIDPRVKSAMEEVDAQKLYQKIEKLLSIADPDVACCADCGSAACEGAFLGDFDESSTEAKAEATEVTEPSNPTIDAPQDTDGKTEDQPDELQLELERAGQLKLKNRLKLANLLGRVAENYPNCATGQKSQRFLEILMQDTAFAAQVEKTQNSKEIANLFEQATMYHRSGLQDKAAEMFQQIIEQYPDSEYADKARAELRSK